MPGDLGWNELEANRHRCECHLMSELMPIIRRARRPLMDPDYRVSAPLKVEPSATVEAPALPPPIETEANGHELTPEQAEPNRPTGQRQNGSRSARK
jgi:hypothetical protein